MKAIWYIIKKELKRFFTDPRMIVGIVLPGVLIYFVYSIMGTMLQEQMNVSEFNVYVENYPDEFTGLLNNEAYKVNVSDENLTKEEILTKIKEKSLDCYIVFEEDFINKISSYNQESGDPAPTIEIYYNSSKESSQSFYNIFVTAMNQYESTIANKFDININASQIYDMATKEDLSIMLISMMLPFLLMTFLFSGTMSISGESIAGEKERGTIATLLITPVSRSYIVMGKLIALAVTSLVSALVSFVSLIFSLPNLMGDNITLEVYGATSIILLFVVISLTVLLFTTMITIISTYSKSVKESSSLCVPLMVVIMLVGATGFMQTSMVSNKLLYLLPVYNSLQCFRGLLSLSMDPICLLITIGSNIICIAIGVFVLTKMFNSEKVMFNK